jgi:4-amino-4-deoxy-L-arabinose transferase-like glycosyltransferase
MEELNKLEKILNFLDKNFNILVILVFLLAIILRLKYLTINQTVWFDEAVYLSAAKSWAFGSPNFEFNYVRPALLPFFMAGLYKLGATEFVFRILIFLSSLVGVFFTYLVGKKLFNKRIALIATLLISVSYTNIFFTARILTDIPSLALWLVSTWLFWKGYVEKASKVYLWLLGVFMALGILLRFPFGILAIIFLFYLLITEGFKFLKNKHLWIGSLISILLIIPYALWYRSTYNLIPFISAAGFYPPAVMLKNYTLFFLLLVKSHFSLSLFIFVIGLGILMFKILMGYDYLRKDNQLKKKLFSFLWLATTLIYFVFLSGIAEERYLIFAAPVVFYIVGFGLMKLYSLTKKHNLLFALVLLIAILLSHSLVQMQQADKLVQLKHRGNVGLRGAGNFINQNSQSSDKVIASGVPILTYYSDREIVYWPSEEEFKELVKDEDIKYMVLGSLEDSPDWSYAWPDKNKDKVDIINIWFPNDDTTKRPLAVLLQFKR